MWMGGRSWGDAIATARLSKSHGAANSRGTPRSRRFRDYGLPRLSVKSTCVVLLFSTCPGDRHLSASTACSSHLLITTLESKVSRLAAAVATRPTTSAAAWGECGLCELPRPARCCQGRLGAGGGVSRAAHSNAPWHPRCWAALGEHRRSRPTLSEASRADAASTAAA